MKHNMTGIIIQARMSSTRLPGKVLKKLARRTVLWHVVERCTHSKEADKIIIATSTDKSDDAISNFCASRHIPVFRGSLHNVLKRYYTCAKKFGITTIVRITSDCPLIDPHIIDAAIRLHRKSRADYVGNNLHRIFPRGLDVEVFSSNILTQAMRSARDNYAKEHVTPYIIQHGKTRAYTVPPAYRGNFRLTLDEPNDYTLLKFIYNKFYKSPRIIDAAQVIGYLKKHPKIAKMNSAVAQKNTAAIAVLGGALVKDRRTGTWRTSTLQDKGDKFGVQNDRLRVIAASYLAKKYPNDVIIVSGGKGQLKNVPQAPTLAHVIKHELMRQGIAEGRIIEEDKSGTTYEQLLELKNIMTKLELKKVKIVSNQWHLPRIRAIIIHRSELNKMSKISHLALIPAEKILLQINRKKWQPIIKEAHSSARMKTRIRLEQKGIRDIKAGSYKFTPLPERYGRKTVDE